MSKSFSMSKLTSMLKRQSMVNVAIFVAVVALAWFLFKRMREGVENADPMNSDPMNSDPMDPSMKHKKQMAFAKKM